MQTVNEISVGRNKTYTRYSCTCSKGFTRVLKVNGTPTCGKCLSSAYLKVHIVRANNGR